MADIKVIARLLALSAGMSETAKVLKEEYGIEAAVADNQKITDVAEQSDALERSRKRIASEQRYLQSLKNKKTYWPRTIGKPRGFPQNMRRK